MSLTDPTDITSPDISGASATRQSNARRMMRNFFALGSSQIFTLVASAVLAVVLPRFLGDVSLGKYAFAATYTGFFRLAVTLGITTHLTKEIARRHDMAGTYALNAVLLRLPMSALAAGAGILLINLLGYDEVTRRAVYILFVNMALMTIYDILLATLQGVQEMRPVAISQVVLKVANSLMVTTLLLAGFGVLEVAAASGASVAVGMLVVLPWLPGRIKMRGSISPAIWGSLIVGGLPYLLWRASNLTYSRVEVIFLSAFASDAVIGWNSAAYRLLAVYTFIPATVMTVVFPALSASRDRMDEFSATVRRALQVVLVGTVPMAAGLFLLSDKLVHLLYTSQFEQTIPVLMILSFKMPLVASAMIIGSAVIALDKQKKWAVAGVSAAVLNPAMNIALIPLTQSLWSNGAIGAAVATLCTEAFLVVWAIRLLPPGILNRSTVMMAARVVAAALIMTGPVLLLEPMFVAIPIVVGALVYWAACLALGAVAMKDIREVMGYFIRRQRPSPAGAN